MSNIRYQLLQPEKIVHEGEAWGVILPTGEINLTVINNRAPSVVKVDDGVLQIIDTQGTVQDKFFIRQGIATIADDFCIVASENIIAFDDITYQEAWAKSEQDAFYNMISEEKRNPK